MVTYNTMGYSPYMLGLWGGPLAHTVGLTPTELRPRRDAEAALLGPIGLSERAGRARSASSALPARPALTAAVPGPLAANHTEPLWLLLAPRAEPLR